MSVAWVSIEGGQRIKIGWCEGWLLKTEPSEKDSAEMTFKLKDENVCVCVWGIKAKGTASSKALRRELDGKLCQAG